MIHSENNDTMDAKTTEVADRYFETLAHKEISQPKHLVLFSGVPGSGKSTIAKAIEDELRAVRISHDEVRDLIKEAFPDLDLGSREKPSVQVFKKLFMRIAKVPNGLVVIDASCDRSYDGYKKNVDDFGYDMTLIRMEVPREIIKQRIRDRGNVGYRDATHMLSKLDIWWGDWEKFGARHEFDLVVRPEDDLRGIVEFVRGRAGV